MWAKHGYAIWQGPTYEYHVHVSHRVLRRPVLVRSWLAAQIVAPAAGIAAASVDTVTRCTPPREDLLAENEDAVAI